MLRTVIIEDEQNVKTSLESKLRQYCPNVQLAGWAQTVNNAIALITAEKPELVLLDIKLPDGTGFDILKALSPPAFKTIFITAYNDFAIEAFRHSALDYLLKPVRANDLVAAVGKAAQAASLHGIEKQLGALWHNLEHITRSEKKIVLNTAESIHIAEVKDIVRCEADGNYTIIHFCDKSKLTLSRTLKDYDEMLEPLGFFRCHKSHLVNLSYIKTIEKTDGGRVRMKDGSEVPLSTARKADVIRVFDKMMC